MIKVTIVGILMFVSMSSIGQVTNRLSIDFGPTYSQYIYVENGRDVVNRFNYGAYISFYQQIRRFKVGLGINPVKCYYSEKYLDVIPSPKTIVQKDFRSTILFWDLQFVFGIKENKNWNINFSTGIVVATVLNPQVDVTYLNGEKLDLSDDIYSPGFGLLNIGVAARKRINEKWSFVFSPAYYLRFSYATASQNDQMDFPIFWSTINFKVGVSYLVGKENLSH
jgi:hypothetical protein